jgi:hypothetical protein
MEEVLEIYHLPYDEDFPVVCFDESNKQLVREIRTPIPCKPGAVQRVDDEYVRNGVANIFMEVEPLAGKRHVGISATRKRVDFALHIREMLNERYPKAQKVVLILDNLNTHNIASLYEAFPASEAQRLAKRLEIHHTPKHGSWMNMAEIELSALKGQCLNRRIPDMPSMQAEVTNWQISRNNKNSKICWQFTTAEARVKLKRLYPQF